MIKVNRKVQYAQGFDGLIQLQDLTGSAQLFNDDPIDTDAMSMEDESYLNASGRLRKRLNTIAKNRQKRVAVRQNNRSKLATSISNKINTKAKTKLTNAKAQLVAAKNSGKTDPALVAALSQPIAAQTSSKMSTGVKIAIGVGALLAIAATIYFIKKHKK